MAVIFGGGELSSFVRFNALETTEAGTFAAPARCGIHVKKNGYIRTDTLALVSDIWLHLDINIAQVTAGLTPITVSNNSGVVVFAITSEGKVMVGTTQIGTVPFMTPGRFVLDIHLKGGASGLIEIYADSQIAFSANGNYALANMQTLTLSPTGQSTDDVADTNTIYSQIIVATEVTIGSKLATLVLETAGSNSQWTGTSSDAAAAINEVGLDDATYISASTAGLISTWATSDLDPQYVNVRAVIVSALGKYSTSGPKTVEAATRTNGGNYYQPMGALGPGYTPSQAIFNVNPVTNAAWTRDEVNAAEFGVRSKV
jgi:hypothetical protein